MQKKSIYSERDAEWSEREKGKFFSEHLCKSTHANNFLNDDEDDIAYTRTGGK